MSRDDVLVEAAARGGAGGVGVGPAVLVAAELVDLLVLGQRRAGHRCAGHAGVLSRSFVAVLVRASCGVLVPVQGVRGGLSPDAGPGMCVVQTPSPWAMVARRCTCVPTSRRDHRGLGLAQLRELGGDVRHRAVVLAQLPAARRSPSAVAA